MKHLLICLFMALVAGEILFAQVSSPGVVPGGAVSARDGFTKSGTSVLFTRNGVFQKIVKEVLLENGLRVQGDGSVTLPSGEKTSLRGNQLLTLSGRFEEVALSPQGTAPVSSVVTPMKKEGEEIGASSTDGVTVVSGAVLVTRNGVTERPSQEFKLNNGTRVRPDGTVTFADGEQSSLRAGEVLTFEGLLLDASGRPIPGFAESRGGDGRNSNATPFFRGQRSPGK